MSSVAALSPALDTWMYQWLFTFTVAGGISALLAAVVLGVQTLQVRLDATVAAEIDALARQKGAFEQRDP